MYRVGEFSRLCQVTIRTLRYYDELGILRPNIVDKFTGYRYYSSNQLKDYHNILLLKELGFSLDEIKTNIKDINDVFISNKIKELEREQGNLSTKLNVLDKMKRKLNSGEDIMDINVVEIDSYDFIIAGFRKVVKNRKELEKYFCEAKEILDKANIKYKGKAIINEDVEYLDEELDLIIGYELEETESTFMANIPLPLHADFDLEVKNKKRLSVVCENTVENINNAYSSIIEYANTNNFQIVAQFIEKHYDSSVHISVSVRKLRKKTEEEFKEYLEFQKTHMFKGIYEGIFKCNELMIGSWQLIDILPKSQMFDINKRKKIIDCGVKELVLLPEGKINDILSWSDGSILHHLEAGILHNHCFVLSSYDNKIMRISFWDEHVVMNGGSPVSYYYEKIE